MRDAKYWKTVMEASAGEDIPDTPPVEDEIEPLMEIVYPYNLTEQMVKIYEDPAYGRATIQIDIYREIMVKLLRSVKYWRQEIPRWLPQRLRTLGVL